MTFMDSLILGILQGVTEFLPISSSGHLVLGQFLLGLEVASLKSYDVVVHLGSLLAILVYFWVDVKRMLLALWALVRGKLSFNDEYAKLIGYILIGTVPAVFAGLFLEDWIDGIFRNVEMVAISMMVVAGFFLVSEYIYWRRREAGMTWYKAIIVGMAQAVALIPGVSRSGMTISTGIIGGVERSEAARFSFLLGIPAIAGAGVLTAANGFEGNVEMMPLFVGFASSFVFGLISVHFLMKFLKKRSLAVFAVYLLIVGGLNLAILNF